MGARRGAWVRRGLGTLVALLVSASLIAVGWLGVGRWLVVADPLRPSQAAVVLGGGFPYRVMEAATLYQDRWVTEVWLLTARDPGVEAVLARVGLHSAGEEVANRDLLRRLAVPAGAIRVLDTPVRNTLEEMKLVRRELTRVGGRSVIIVTSKPHSRRVRTTWRAVTTEGLSAIVRYPGEDPYDAAHWWRNSRDALAVSREVFGLINTWAGFPIRPDGV